MPGPSSPHTSPPDGAPLFAEGGFPIAPTWAGGLLGVREIPGRGAQQRSALQDALFDEVERQHATLVAIGTAVKEAYVAMLAAVEVEERVRFKEEWMDQLRRWSEAKPRFDEAFSAYEEALGERRRKTRRQRGSSPGAAV